MKQVVERSTAYLAVSFIDKAGEPAAPLTVQYRIDCDTTGEVVRDWTDVSAAPTVEIVLTAAENAMRNPSNRNERRTVTVIGSYGGDDQVRDRTAYYIHNLDHAS